MGAAKAMAHSGMQLKRSVMFLFFGGEENGLLGSKLYHSKTCFQKKKELFHILISIWLATEPDLAVVGGEVPIKAC